MSVNVHLSSDFFSRGVEADHSFDIVLDAIHIRLGSCATFSVKRPTGRVWKKQDLRGAEVVKQSWADDTAEADVTRHESHELGA